MEKKETLKEKLEKVDKKILIAFVLGGIVGSIIAKRDMKAAVQMARARGYSSGVSDILKSILPVTK